MDHVQGVHVPALTGGTALTCGVAGPEGDVAFIGDSLSATGCEVPWAAPRMRGVVGLLPATFIDTGRGLGYLAERGASVSWKRQVSSSLFAGEGIPVENLLRLLWTESLPCPRRWAGQQGLRYGKTHSLSSKDARLIEQRGTRDDRKYHNHNAARQGQEPNLRVSHVLC